MSVSPSKETNTLFRYGIFPPSGTVETEDSRELRRLQAREGDWEELGGHWDVVTCERHRGALGGRRLDGHDLLTAHMGLRSGSQTGRPAMGRGDLTCVLVVGYLPAVGVVGDVDFERRILSVSEEQGALWGFRLGERGTHTSRTIMLGELWLLLEAAAVSASDVDYEHVVIDEQCLGRRTRATRRLTVHRVAELRGLNRRRVVFRVVRDLWEHHSSSRPAPGPAVRARARPVAPGYHVRRDPQPIWPGDLQTIHDRRRVGGSPRSPEPADDGRVRAQRLVFVGAVRASARQQHQGRTACVRDACGDRVRAAGSDT